MAGDAFVALGAMYGPTTEPRPGGHLPISLYLLGIQEDREAQPLATLYDRDLSHLFV